MKKAALYNLGCKVNAYETEAIQQMLQKNNYEIVPFTQKADIYIINTCTVTNIADKKSRQILHRARRMNPEAIVVAMGCYVEAGEERVLYDQGIDILIGNEKKNKVLTILEQYIRGEKEGKDSLKEEESIENVKKYGDMFLEETKTHTRAYIKIQDGCNQFCSYCIIPYVRGRVRSREKKSILKEVENLAKKNYKEIVLTGIHLSSYGSDLEGGKKGESLLDLIEALHNIEGLKRIRLGSLEPGIIKEEFVKKLKGYNKLCPHFHLSLQSGCDATLKRMDRQYTTGEYYEKVNLLREEFFDPAITTDVIVGFPKETEEEFQTTYEFLEKICLYEMHVFKYSKRQGTKAASMEGQVQEAVKTKRSSQLLFMAKNNKKAFQERYRGKKVAVLFEESLVTDGISHQTGYTREYIKVKYNGHKNYINQIVEGRILPEEDGDVPVFEPFMH